MFRGVALRGIGRTPVRRQELFEPSGGVRLNSDQDIADVVVGIYGMQATGRNDGVQDGEVLCAFSMSGKQRVFAPQRNDA